MKMINIDHNENLGTIPESWRPYHPPAVMTPLLFTRRAFPEAHATVWRDSWLTTTWRLWFPYHISITDEMLRGRGMVMMKRHENDEPSEVTRRLNDRDEYKRFINDCLSQEIKIKCHPMCYLGNTYFTISGRLYYVYQKVHYLKLHNRSLSRIFWSFDVQTVDQRIVSFKFLGVRKLINGFPTYIKVK